MNLPSCLLCIRTSTPCVFPSGRKRRKITPQESQHQAPGIASIPAGEK